MGGKENDPSGQIISLEAVTDFFLKNNGKVKQTALLNQFRQQLSNPLTKARARQEFKDILQLVTAAKTENGEKYFILIQQNHEHSQALVTNRRTLAQRKESARSRYEIPRTPPTLSEEEDNVPPSHHGSSGTISSQDSGVAFDSSSSMTSVALLRSSLKNTIASTQSMDSIDGLMTDGGDEDGDLEDDLGLNDGVEVLPEEKKWMLASAHGQLDKLKDLIEIYPHLTKKKDFVLGYTALHWAAKLDRPDIIKFITSAGGDISSKSHGGYTPLHLAAFSGKDQAITQLIELYGADIHARDNSGKKPKDLVKETVSADVQRKLGRSLILEPNHFIEPKYFAKVKRHSPATLRARHQSVPNIKLSTSENDISPKETPETARRHKSLSSQGKRPVSFLNKKRKYGKPLTAEDIKHSPIFERRNSESNGEIESKNFIQVLPTDEHRVRHRVDSLKESSKNRPKTQYFSKDDKPALLDPPIMSFEI